MIPGSVTGAVRDRPQIGDYRWRARTYPHAVRAIERAEAEHGPPVPTCLCGGRIRWGTGHNDITNGTGLCETCGERPSS